MATAKSWLFEQLSGDEKTLTLDGWAAPLGRPRQGAVVRDAIEIRVTDTYYPGSDEPPTRHIFGDKYVPWDLKGRFRDRAGGVGFAKAKTDEVKDFVRDKQPVRISWGDIVSVNGFLVKFDPGRESEGEVEWTLTANIDGDNFKKKKRSVQQDDSVSLSADLLILDMKAAMLDLPHVPSGTPFDVLTQIQNSFTSIENAIEFPSNVASGFLDALDDVASAASAISKGFVDIANSVDRVKSTPETSLGRMNATAGQLRDAWRAVREAYSSAPVSNALLSETSEKNTQLWQSQANIDAAIRTLMADVSRFQRAVRIQLKGKHTTTATAKQGDTWESISTTVYGDPSRADDIRQANGIPPGAYPVVGTTYILSQ